MDAFDSTADSAVTMYGEKIALHAHGVLNKEQRASLKEHLRAFGSLTHQTPDIRAQIGQKVAEYLNLIIRPTVP